jgi:hypothetical protein
MVFTLRDKPAQEGGLIEIIGIIQLSDAVESLEVGCLENQPRRGWQVTNGQLQSNKSAKRRSTTFASR